MNERLQKVLARAGIASRRAAEGLIREGRVRVNGTVVTELGTKVDPGRDAIKVDGRRIPAAPPDCVYLMLNKPKGYVTTLSDPEGRPAIRDLLERVGRRVFPVGRLDFHSEGLLLLTDDGELARDLMHPGKRVPKTYEVKVRGRPTAESLRRIERGVILDGRKTLPARARMLRPEPNSWVEIRVVEGRKHQVRRMLDAVGHRVLKLKRTTYGGVRLGGLAAGALRPLTSVELARLRRACGRPVRKPRSAVID